MITLSLYDRGHKKKILNLVLLFYVVFSSGSMLSMIYPKFFIIFGVILATVVFLLSGLTKRKILLLSRIFLCAALYIAIQYMFLSPYAEAGELSQVLNLLCAFYISCVTISIYINNINFLSVDLDKVLSFCLYHGIISFFLWAIIKDNLIAFDDTPWKTYLYLFYYTDSSPIFNLTLLNRNNGFFWEPGVYQFYLNILLALTLYNFKFYKALLILLLIITTWSTTGMLCAIVQLLLYTINNYKKSLFQSFLILLLFPLLLSTFLINSQDKFTGENITSSQARAYDLQKAIGIITEYPIFGIGQDWNIYKKLSRNIVIEGPVFTEKDGEERFMSTNSLANLGVRFGLPFSVFFIYFYYKQRIFTSKVPFFVISMFSFYSEPLIFLPFPMLFFVSGIIGILKNNRNI